jgi:hypothetical protein
VLIAVQLPSRERNFALRSALVMAGHADAAAAKLCTKLRKFKLFAYIMQFTQLCGNCVEMPAG